GKEFQHALHVGSAAAAGELAITEGAGAALAKEVIALRMERPAAIERSDVADAIADGPAAFEQQRAIALFGKKIRRRQSARPRADDHRSMIQRPRTRRGHFKACRTIWLDARVAGGPGASHLGEASLVVRHLDLDAVNELQPILVAGVETLTEDAPRAARNSW